MRASRSVLSLTKNTADVRVADHAAVHAFMLKLAVLHCDVSRGTRRLPFFPQRKV
jgi:hypothetical protein